MRSLYTSGSRSLGSLSRRLSGLCCSFFTPREKYEDPKFIFASSMEQAMQYMVQNNLWFEVDSIFDSSEF